MKRLAYVVVLFFATLLSGCAELHYLKHKDDIIRVPAADRARAPKRMANTTIERRLSYPPLDANAKTYPPRYTYSQLIIRGPANVTIAGHQPDSVVKYALPGNHLGTVTIKELRGKLYITTKYPTTIDITLTNDIHYFSDIGAGKVNATNIGYSGLGVTLGDDVNMTLRGEIHLTSASVGGDSSLHTYWIDNTKLKVHALGNAKVFLAGVAKDLDAVVTGDSVLDAKYLRTYNAHVTTIDNSTAAITVWHAMNVLAKNSSTIYYYRDPEFQAVYLDNAGSVLRMQGLPSLPLVPPANLQK